MKLYNKDGEEFNVPYAVDAKDWLESGEYSKENPKDKKPAKKEDTKKETKTEK